MNPGPFLPGNQHEGGQVLAAGGTLEGDCATGNAGAPHFQRGLPGIQNAFNGRSHPRQAIQKSAMGPLHEAGGAAEHGFPSSRRHLGQKKAKGAAPLMNIQRDSVSRQGPGPADDRGGFPLLKDFHPEKAQACAEAGSILPLVAASQNAFPVRGRCQQQSALGQGFAPG